MRTELPWWRCCASSMVGRAEQRADLLARSARIASDYGQCGRRVCLVDAAASSFSRAGDATRERAARIAEGVFGPLTSMWMSQRGCPECYGAPSGRCVCDGPAAQRFAYRALACAEGQ